MANLISLVAITVFIILWFAVLILPRRPVNQVQGEATPKQRAVVGAVLSTIFLVFWLFSQSFVQVPTGNVAVGSLFGSVQKTVYRQGVNLFANPFLAFTDFSVRRQTIQFNANANKSQGGDGAVAVSSDKLSLTENITFAFKLNPRFAWWVYQNLGGQDTYISELVKPAARAAARNATLQLSYLQAMTSGHNELAADMQQAFQENLVQGLVMQGMDPKAAAEVFTVLPVNVQQVLPPAKVQNAIAEKAAAEQDLARQVTLTKIARQAAIRRAAEGLGVQKLFSMLPKGFTAKQIKAVLGALANKERADALMKAIETGQVKVVVMNGSTPAMSLPTK